MKSYWLLLTLCLLSYKNVLATIDISSALQKGLIQVEIRGLGGYQGYCVSLKVRNLSADSLHLRLGAGTRLNSADEGQQDLLVVENVFLALGRKETKKVRVKSFCCQANGKSPGSGSAFFFGSSDSTLKKVALYLCNRSFPDAVIQHAVWSVSDGRPVGVVGNGADAGIGDLRRFLSILKNEPVPWYDLHANIIHYRSGRMEASPYLLTGALQYRAETAGYGSLTVRDSLGKQVGIISEQWLVKGENKRIDLMLPVAGLSKGKYIVELVAGGTSITRKEFIL